MSGQRLRYGKYNEGNRLKCETRYKQQTSNLHFTGKRKQPFEMSASQN